VAWPLGDQAKQHIAQIAMVEEAPDPAAATAMVVPVMAAAAKAASKHPAACVATVVVCVSVSKHFRLP
jgi:hypothetical protein